MHPQLVTSVRLLWEKGLEGISLRTVVRPQEPRSEFPAEKRSTPVEMVSHPGIGCDPGGWPQSKHGLPLLQGAEQTFQRVLIKTRLHFDPAYAR